MLDRGQIKMKTHKISIWILIFIILLQISILPISGFIYQNVDDTNNNWWDESWSHRIEITVTNPSTTLNDYQLMLTLSIQDLYQNAKSSGDDVRFIDFTNSIQFNYFIEKWDNTAESKIWVKIPILDGNNQTIFYLYFGNPEAESESSESGVFDFDDDFSNDQWTYYNESMINYDFANQQMNIHTSRSRIDDYAYSSKVLPSNWEMRFQFEFKSTSEEYSQIYVGCTATNAGVLNNLTYGLFLQALGGVASTSYHPTFRLLVKSYPNVYVSGLYQGSYNTIYNIHLRKITDTAYYEIWSNDYSSMLYSYNFNFPSLTTLNYVYVCGGSDYPSGEGYAELDNIKIMKTTSTKPTYIFGEATTQFTSNFLIHLAWIIPVSLLTVIGIVLGIIFGIKKRKAMIEADPDRKAKKEVKKEAVREAREARKSTRTFRPPIIDYFRVMGSIPVFYVKSCIYGCCCLLWNIIFRIILGVIVCPIWLLIRLGIFVKIDDEKIVMRNAFGKKLVWLDDIENITIQGVAVTRTLNTYENLRKVSSQQMGEAEEPHSIMLLIKSKAQGLVLFDLKRYTFNKGLDILEALLKKIEARPNVSNITMSGEIAYINRI
ncbi:MAG: DUF2341 domain-containing protein [Asgard group archaeon]|nr:DUF2341 domain-containing protein [Asgard group archaeon]